MNNNLVTALTIPDSVTSINSGAFYNCRSLTSVTIPDSVTSIGGSAFNGCSSLTSVTIGNNVTSIGGGAFNGCYKVIEVRNTSTLNITAGSSDYGYVGYYAKRVYAEGKSYLSTDKDGYIIYDDGTDKILVRYTGKETDLTLPSSITQINGYAFFGCTSLTSVTIPDSVTSIGGSAFNGCSSLTSVTIGNNVTSIGGGAFNGCYKVIEVRNTSTLNITAGSSDYGYVGYYAKRVYAEGKSYLSTDKDGYIIYDDGTDKILVSYTGKETDLTLPISITQINGYAFYNCTSLKSVTIGNGVKSIGKYAFYGCTSLEKVYYKGTAADWEKISINNNSDLTNATRYYYSESKPTGSGNYWHYVDGKPTVWVSDEEN